jgi:hypothetical protein
MSHKHRKHLYDKCAICGEEPAYWQKVYGNYLCLKHAVKFRKKLISMAVAAAGTLIFTYFLI